MDALARNAGGRGSRRWQHGLAALWFAWGGGVFAQDVVTVPAAHLDHAEGSVAYAPSGDQEWHDVQPRRLLKRGDRLWTDRGSRAELQAGGHAVRLNGETQLVLENVGETATQLNLTQGSIAATVTRANPGDSFEVGTPNLAFRARQVGDYRIDVDASQGVTRVVVLSGSAAVYGEKGEAVELHNGQRATFRERDLTRVPQSAFTAADDFDRWVGARRRGEPTVTMPALAANPPAAPPSAGTGLVSKGRDLVIAGPPAPLHGAKPAAGGKAHPARAASAAPAPAKAQALPNVTVIPAAPPAVPLRVAAAGTPAAAAPVNTATEAPAKAQGDAAAKAQREQEQKRVAAQRVEEERKRAQARRAAEEKRLAAARKAEAQKLAENRRRQLARLQEQARREEQAVQTRREQQARRTEEERREEAARREEQARREQERRNEEVWLHQQQQSPNQNQQPVRPAPMSVPARRIS